MYKTRKLYYLHIYLLALEFLSGGKQLEVNIAVIKENLHKVDKKYVALLFTLKTVSSFLI